MVPKSLILFFGIFSLINRVIIECEFYDCYLLADPFLGVYFTWGIVT